MTRNNSTKMTLKKFKPKGPIGWLGYGYLLLSAVGYLASFLLPDWYLVADWPNKYNVMLLTIYFLGSLLLFYCIREADASVRIPVKNTVKDKISFGFTLLLVNMLPGGGVSLLLTNTIHTATAQHGYLHLTVVGKESNYRQGVKPVCIGGVRVEHFGRMCLGNKTLWQKAEKEMTLLFKGDVSELGVTIDELSLIDKKKE